MTTAMPTTVDPISTTYRDYLDRLPASDYNTLKQAVRATSRIVVGPTQYNAASDAYGTYRDGTNAAATTTGAQACIDACQAAGGGIVTFPPGHYLLNDKLTVASYGAITIQGGGNFTGAAVAGQGTRLHQSVANKDVLQIHAALEMTSVYVKDLFLDGAGSSSGANGHGLHLLADSNVTASLIGVERVTALNNGGSGIFFDHGDYGHLWFVVHVRDCQGISNGGHGIYLYEVLEAEVDNCYVGSNGLSQFCLSARSQNNNCENIYVRRLSVDISDNSNYGIEIANAADVRLEGTWLEPRGSAPYGLVSVTGVNGLRIEGGNWQQTINGMRGLVISDATNPSQNIVVDVPIWANTSDQKRIYPVAEGVLTGLGIRLETHAGGLFTNSDVYGYASFAAYLHYQSWS